MLHSANYRRFRIAGLVIVISACVSNYSYSAMESLHKFCDLAAIDESDSCEVVSDEAAESGE